MLRNSTFHELWLALVVLSSTIEVCVKIYYGELSHVTLFTFRILGWCMVCKWALPTPEIYLTIGSNQELSHLGSSCESRKLSFHVSELELRCIAHRRSKWWFSNSWSDCIDAFKLCSQLNLEWWMYIEHRVESHCNTCLFGVIPLKYRRLIKKVIT